MEPDWRPISPTCRTTTVAQEVMIFWWRLPEVATCILIGITSMVSPWEYTYISILLFVDSIQLGAHDPLTPRNSGERPGGMNLPQRPSNLALESPRKHIIETKTDYGKYRLVFELMYSDTWWLMGDILFVQRNLSFSRCRIRQQFKENLFSNKSQPNLHYYSLCCHNRRFIYSKYDTLVWMCLSPFLYAFLKSKRINLYSRCYRSLFKVSSIPFV